MPDSRPTTARIVFVTDELGLKSDDLFRRLENGQISNKSVTEPGFELVLADDLKHLPEISRRLDKVYGGLACIAAGILMLDDKITRLEETASRIEETLVLLVREAAQKRQAKLKRVHELLARADRKGDAAGACLREKEEDIVQPINEIIEETIARLVEGVAEPETNLCLLERLLRLRHLRAKISLVIGEPEEAHTILQTTRTYVRQTAHDLLAAWAQGVYPVALPQVETVEDLKKLLAAMQLIDGKELPARIFEFYHRGQPPEMKEASLWSPWGTQRAEWARNLEDETPVRKGQVVGWDGQWRYFAQTFGYLRHNSSNNLNDWRVTRTLPIAILFDSIMSLAALVRTADDLEQVMGWAAGSEPLAKLLAWVSVGEPRGYLAFYEGGSDGHPRPPPHD